MNASDYFSPVNQTFRDLFVEIEQLAEIEDMIKNFGSIDLSGPNQWPLAEELASQLASRRMKINALLRLLHQQITSNQ